MNGFLYETASSLATLLGQDGVFIAFSTIILALGIVNLLLACLVFNYGIKKRLWQPCVCIFILCTCSGVCAVADYGFFIPLLVMGVASITVIPVFAVPVKVFKVTEKQRDLVKFIDSEIKQATKEKDCTACDKTSYKEQVIKAENVHEEKNVADFDLDFKHVKSVINRLDYFGLKESDKKQVKELENALISAEKGNFGQDVKCRINDGLSALLKIMSKYGV